jgi:hypothetical protein
MCSTHVDSSDARGDIPHRNNLGIITMPTLSIMASYRRSAPQLLERPAGAVRPASLAASGVSLLLAVSIGSRPGKCHFNYFRRDHNRHQRLLSTTAPMYTTTPFGFFFGTTQRSVHTGSNCEQWPGHRPGTTGSFVRVPNRAKDHAHLTRTSPNSAGWLGSWLDAEASKASYGRQPS